MDEFFHCMKHETLKDVIVPGYIDDDRFGKQFHPIYDNWFFIFETKIYKIFLNKTVNIDAEVVDKVGLGWDVDEDDEFGVMSIYEPLFKTDSEITINDIGFMNSGNSLFSELIIKYTTGISLSGEGRRKSVVIEPDFSGFMFYNSYSGW